MGVGIQIAPFSMRSFAMPTCPFPAAACKGVMPYLSQHHHHTEKPWHSLPHHSTEEARRFFPYSLQLQDEAEFPALGLNVDIKSVLKELLYCIDISMCNR